MKQLTKLPALLLILPLALTGLACVTINVYFPEAAVKDLSERIEDAVVREAADDATESESASEDGGSHASLDSSWYEPLEIGLGVVLAHLPAGTAHAQGQVAEPEITNPAIRRIVTSRADRVDEIDKYKASGVLGETNKALLEVRSLDSLALRERATVQKLVKEENEDRERMFKEIAAATGTDLSQLPQIQTTYAETLRERANAGDWIQLASGEWKQK